MIKNITIFGSTGSIGKNAINIIKRFPQKYKVTTLVAQNSVKILAQQANLLQPEFVIIENEEKYQDLKSLINYKCNILSGRCEVENIAKTKCDLMISAIMGFAGMIPTINAIKAGTDIAIANKESLVCAGSIIIDLAKKHKVKILPIDSEHNAIFQVFENDNLDKIDDVVLTASGGPFFKRTKNFDDISVKEALNHPKWKMGDKITIDCATMMNKGLELIEAYYLFPIAKDKIDIIVHPQSIIHGIVNYKDGSSLAMMSLPDMKTPISYVLDYPKRIDLEAKKVDFTEVGKFEFFKPDYEKFPALTLCKKTLEAEGNSCTILNAANEIAVAKFLSGDIEFSRIVTLVTDVMNKIEYKNINSVEEIIECDKTSRQIAKKLN